MADIRGVEFGPHPHGLGEIQSVERSAPADPGREATDDRCPAFYKPPGEPAALGPGFPCELDPGHDGEPHQVTLLWCDEVAEPDCEACSDTGQVAGEPCPHMCARAKALILAPDGQPVGEPVLATWVDETHLGRWGDDG